MIVWGWGGGKPTDHGPAVPITCPNCHNETALHYVESRRWFRLYFIPLFPYATKHYLLCPVCTRGTQLDRVQAQHALAMVWTTNGFLAQQVSTEAYARAVDDLYAAIAPPADLGHEDGTARPPHTRWARCLLRSADSLRSKGRTTKRKRPTRMTSQLDRRLMRTSSSSALSQPTRRAGEQR